MNPVTLYLYTYTNSYIYIAEKKKFVFFYMEFFYLPEKKKTFLNCLSNNTV